MSVRFHSEIEQGTEEWLKVREGKVSATDAWSLLHGKSVDEILENKTNNSFKGNFWTKRGHILEDEAREIYSEVYEPINTYGYVSNDKYPNAIESPDGVSASLKFQIEIKCFNEKRHFDVYKNLDSHIIAQIQFQLFISELEYCDLVLYNPDLSPEDAFLTRRIFPDKEIHAKFAELLRK